MAALLVASCSNSTSPEIEESLDLFSGLEAISEAQNTNVTISRGTDATDGYFEITVEGVDANPFLAPGAHEAWCLEWHKNLRSNGDVHTDVKWFSTGDNATWKPLNYLFSIRRELQANDPDLTFRDLQAVVWVLAGEMGIAPAFDVLNMPVSQIPSRLRAGDELAIDREKVAGIARRVMNEAPKATVLPAGTVAQTAEDQQDIYVSISDRIIALHDFYGQDREAGLSFEEGAILSYKTDGSAASITGIAFLKDGALGGTRWEVTATFGEKNELTEPKKELEAGTYIENGGSIDVQEWILFLLEEGSEIKEIDAEGNYTGRVISLTRMPENGQYGLQIGEGASGKSTNLGASVWFFWTFEGNTGSGDFKIDSGDLNMSHPAL